MHLVAISPGIPSPSSGGGGVFGSSLLKYFAKSGHQTTLLTFRKYAVSPVDPEAERAYERLGIRVVHVDYEFPTIRSKSALAKLKMLLTPDFGDIWPDYLTMREPVQRALDELKPDCVLPWAFDATMFTHGYRGAPRVGYLAEGPHINAFVNWKFNPEIQPGLSLEYAVYSARAAMGWRLYERLYAKAAKDLTIPAFMAPHYAEWAREKGIANSVYIPIPVTDSQGARWHAERERARTEPGARFKILLIGQLYSTSNRSGLPMFFEEILPTLEREWGAEKFEVHIVAKEEGLPGRFDKYRSHPSLIFRGSLHHPDEEFLSADVLLVPVPARTGPRVRIIHGFSFGSCVVAHRANALGVPELRHDENALLADTGVGMARQVIRAAGDAALRDRLGKAGRLVYERSYTEEKAGGAHLSAIERARSLPGAQ